jgi:hypothetical protein
MWVNPARVVNLHLKLPQDVMSRHRGAKHRRRYELLGGISLLSPAYLLSVERWPFHTEPPDHYDLLSCLLNAVVGSHTRTKRTGVISDPLLPKSQKGSRVIYILHFP